LPSTGSAAATLRGGLGRFISAKQSKCAPSNGEWADSRRNPALEVPRPQASIVEIGVVSSGKLEFVPLTLRLDYMSTPPTCWAGKVLALDGQTRAVIF
jgi:hypothetical protein